MIGSVPNTRNLWLAFTWIYCFGHSKFIAKTLNRILFRSVLCFQLKRAVVRKIVDASRSSGYDTDLEIEKRVEVQRRLLSQTGRKLPVQPVFAWARRRA